MVYSFRRPSFNQYVYFNMFTDSWVKRSRVCRIALYIFMTKGDCSSTFCCVLCWEIFLQWSIKEKLSYCLQSLRRLSGYDIQLHFHQVIFLWKLWQYGNKLEWMLRTNMTHRIATKYRKEDLWCPMDICMMQLITAITFWHTIDLL